MAPEEKLEKKIADWQKQKKKFNMSQENQGTRISSVCTEIIGSTLSMVS